MGLCTPASCSHKDIENELNGHIRNKGMNQNNFNVSYHVKVNPSTCQTDRTEEGFDPADWTFW